MRILFLVGYDSASLCSDISGQYSTLTLRVEKTFWPLKMRILCCLERSEFDYPLLQCHIREDWHYQLHNCENLKICKRYINFYREINVVFMLIHATGNQIWEPLFGCTDSCNVIVQGKSTVGYTVAAQLLIPVVLALVCTVRTACCQLGSAPVTTISRCAFHLLSEWEERKKTSCGRPW